MCDRPCESGGSVVHAEDGSTAVLGVLESVQPLRKAGSVGMQRTGLMHVGWWVGVLSVLADPTVVAEFHEIGRMPIAYRGKDERVERVLMYYCTSSLLALVQDAAEEPSTYCFSVYPGNKT